MNYLIDEKTVGNKTIKIYQDEGIESPRVSDGNISKLIFFGNSYEHLGDKHGIDLESNYEDRFDFSERGGEFVKKKMKAVAIFPVQVYQHGGISFSVETGGQYGCRFDSGVCGFAVITKEQIRECYGVKRVTQEHIDKAISEIAGELETLNQYVNGEVYGYTITEDDEEVDSCWGFYGTDWKNNGLADEVDDELISALD